MIDKKYGMGLPFSSIVMENSVKTDPGSELYRCFLGGDDQSFTALVKAYRSALVGYITAIIGDETDAEDLAIDSFAVLMSGRKKFNENVLFKTFLFAIGKKLAFKYLRKHRKNASLLSELSIWHKTEISSVADDFFREQDKADISRCMGFLKSDHRSVLYLLFFEDLSYAEAGRVMGKTEGQIRGLVYRAKEALKKKLENESKATLSKTEILKKTQTKNFNKKT